MKVRNLKPQKVNIVTLGCSKNIYDSEILMGQLKANQFDVEHESENHDAGIVVINTCGFIDTAKQESIDTILDWVEAKENGDVNKVYVTGCLSERYRDDLEKEIPQVDAYFGSKELPRLLKTLKADYKTELVGERLLTTPSHYAYMKIAEGCDRPCAFCAIPLMRGKHVSTPIEDLVTQAKKLAAKGTKEIMLIAQDLTYYGLDLYKKRNLSELLRHLSDVEGIDWIRLHYAYPAGFPMDILDVMNERSNICNYLDMPLQHSSDKMLKSMRRAISSKKTRQVVEQIREKVPNIALRTTLISGFPGETEQDFEDVYRFVEDMQFDRLGVFPYSHEEGTHAGDAMIDDVPNDVKEMRAEELMNLQYGIAHTKNQKFLNQKMKVLIDRAESEYYIGRTEYDSPEVDNEVKIPRSEGYLRVGDFGDILITGAEAYDLYGKIAK